LPGINIQDFLAAIHSLETSDSLIRNINSKLKSLDFIPGKKMKNSRNTLTEKEIISLTNEKINHIYKYEMLKNIEQSHKKIKINGRKALIDVSSTESKTKKHLYIRPNLFK